MKCALCNYENEPGAKVCFRCGKFLEEPKKESKKKKIIIISIVAILVIAIAITAIILLNK